VSDDMEHLMYRHYASERTSANRILGWDAIQEQEYDKEISDRATDHPFRHHSMVARFEKIQKKRGIK